MVHCSLDGDLLRTQTQRAVRHEIALCLGTLIRNLNSKTLERSYVVYYVLHLQISQLMLLVCVVLRAGSLNY